MKFYKNARAGTGWENTTGTLISLNSNSYSLHLFEPGTETQQVYDKTYIINSELVSVDQKTKSTIKDPHTIVGLFVHSDGSLKAIDFFKHSKHNKSSIGGVKSHFDVNFVAFVFIPFMDSNISDWTIVLNLDNGTLDGNQLEELNIDKNVSIIEAANTLLPSITLSKSGNEITAQLSVAKANVEIYFETTAGYLNKTRALTDATGKATVKVFGDELEGKVKAGFKHFSGKAEINI